MSKKETDKIKETVLKYTLENAVNHNGKASEKSVMQKIMATHAELRKESKKINDLVEEIVPSINELSIEVK